MTSSTTMLVKRTWCYLQPPKQYDMAPCACGNHDTQWSEYEHHLWCEKCQIDFIPEHAGIFEGPIPVGCAAMFGISFDRLNLETNTVERFDVTGTRF